MSSHVFSLLFKGVLNSTLSWWKTICFLGLVLLWLNTGLGEHERRGTGARVGGIGHPADSGTYSSGKWLSAQLRGTKPSPGWEVLRLGCNWTLTPWPWHKLPVSKWGLFLGTISRLLSSLSLPPFRLSFQLHASTLFSPTIRASSCSLVLLFLVFSLPSSASPSSAITLVTCPLETPSYAPLQIFSEVFQVWLWTSFPSFSTLHLWTISSRIMM